MKTFDIPEEPEEGSRVIGKSGVVYWNTGVWSGWSGSDGNTYEWLELLTDDGPVKELVVPVEAINRLKAPHYGRTSDQDSDIKALIEFAEAFAG